MDYRLNHVAHIVAVARCGSFTAAAREIGVTQSAITRGVADLERQLGYSVFYRTSRRVHLTEKGRNFVERAARLLDDARELLTGEVANADPFASTLRIGVCPASMEWRLIEPIALLQKRHPSIKFEVSGSSFERMAQLLRNGGVDVVLGFDAAFAEWTDLRREPIADLRSTLFVRNGHPLLKQKHLTKSLISEYELISPSDSRPYGAVIRAIYENSGVDWRKRLHVIDYFPIVQRIVSNSDAIGVVALSHAASPSFQRRFSTLDVPDLELTAPTPMCCATRTRWEPSPAARAFIRAVRFDAKSS